MNIEIWFQCIGKVGCTAVVKVVRSIWHSNDINRFDGKQAA